MGGGVLSARSDGGRQKGSGTGCFLGVRGAVGLTDVGVWWWHLSEVWEVIERSSLKVFFFSFLYLFFV